MSKKVRIVILKVFFYSFLFHGETSIQINTTKYLIANIDS